MYVLTLILVVFSAEKVTAIYGGCVTLSLLVHYFTLVAVMWMGAEALLMFQKLVIVFVRITTKFIVFVSIICWCKLTRISLASEHILNFHQYMRMILEMRLVKTRLYSLLQHGMYCSVLVMQYSQCCSAEGT